MMGTSVANAGAAGTPPPSAPVAAFEAARQSSALRAATSLAVTDALVEQAAPSANGTRRGGTHLFKLTDSIWIDVKLTPSTRTVRIAPYSAAYFALLQLLPDLRDALAIGEQVTVAGRSVAIAIAAGGATSLTPSALSAIERDW
jgi:hypothetical protein